MKMRALAVALLLVAGCRGKDDTDASRPASRPSRGGAASANDSDDGDDERCPPRADRVCVGDDVVACEGGELGRRIRSCKDGCKDGRCVANCSTAGAELVYVVDIAGNFMSFDPRKLPGDPFRKIGHLDCEASHAGASPFSMAVDRQGIAWVLYSDGAMFKVSIGDARCQRTTYVPSASGALTFGMGFATDAPGGTTEKLYIAANASDHTLSAIDTEERNPTARDLGTLVVSDQNPELTGTADARLYGFYPATREPAYVQEIDRRTAAPIGTKWTLGDKALGRVSAYAFAQWGGKFYVFATSATGQFGADESSMVHVVDRATGKHSVLLENIAYRIVGAGVSTCAPEKDQ
jgi:hypothetical protein